MQENDFEKNALLFRDKPLEIKYDPNFHQWCSYVLDIININISKTSYADNNETLSRKHTHFLGKIQLQENIPVARYRFIPIVRNKILDYKGTVQSMKLQLVIVKDLHFAMKIIFVS